AGFIVVEHNLDLSLIEFWPSGPDCGQCNFLLPDLLQAPPSPPVHVLNLIESRRRPSVYHEPCIVIQRDHLLERPKTHTLFCFTMLTHIAIYSASLILRYCSWRRAASMILSSWAAFIGGFFS